MYAASSPVISVQDSSIANFTANALNATPHDSVVTTLADGRMVVAGSGVDHGDAVVRFQILNSAGVPVSIPQSALQFTAATPTHVSVAALSNGGFVVQGGGIAQLFSAAGTAIGAPISITGVAGEVTAIGDHFVTAGTAAGNLITTIYTATGQVAQQSTVALATLGGTVSDIQTAAFGAANSASGRIISTWTESVTGLTGTTQTYVRYQMLDGNGNAIGLPFARLTGTSLQPDVAFLKDGSFVLSWTDGTNPLIGGATPATTLYTQHFNASGITLSAAQTVNTGTVSGANGVASSSITALGDGGYLMSWTQNGTSYVRQYDSSDHAVGAQTAIGLAGVDDTAVTSDGHVLAIGTTGQYQLLSGSLTATTASIAGQTATGTANDDAMTATATNITLNGGAGADVLTAAAAGGDKLNGGDGNDIIATGVKGNIIDGGNGFDVLQLAKSAGSYWVQQTANGFTLWDGLNSDTVTNVEGVIANGKAFTIGAFQNAAFNPYAYLASYADLLQGFGDDPVKAYQHWVQHGQAEGRTIKFNALDYLAVNPDLAKAWGDDELKAAQHYVDHGIAEHRAVAGFDALEYGASNPDLAKAYGDDINALELEWVTEGVNQNRPTNTFNALQYAAANPDLAKAWGANTTLLTQHYLEHGASEGRLTTGFDALEYGASNPDLAKAYHDDVNQLLFHYVQFGVKENRELSSFNALEYAATNTDLAKYFGTDANGALHHYLDYGATEGRATAGFDAVAYLLSNSDLAGLGPNGAFYHWLTNGADEGRVGDALYGREQATHSLAGTLGLGTISQAIETPKDHDWFGVTLAQGTVVNLHLSGASSNGGTLTDATMQLFDSAGHLLATDNGAGSDANILISPSASGTYYVTVEGGTADLTGSYTLSALGAGGTTGLTLGQIVAGTVTGVVADVSSGVGGLIDGATGGVTGLVGSIAGGDLTGGLGHLVTDLL